MNEAELIAIEARDQARTPGKWAWDSYSRIIAKVTPDHFLNESEPDEVPIGTVAWIGGGSPQQGHGDELHNEEARGNAAFIAACSEDVPKLAREVRRCWQRERDLLILLAWARGWAPANWDRACRKLFDIDPRSSESDRASVFLAIADTAIEQGKAIIDEAITDLRKAPFHCPECGRALIGWPLGCVKHGFIEEANSAE